MLVAATTAVIGIGQAYGAGLMFDHDHPALESVNQLLIFSPILAVQVWRPKPLATAGLDRAWLDRVAGAAGPATDARPWRPRGARSPLAVTSSVASSPASSADASD